MTRNTANSIEARANGVQNSGLVWGQWRAMKEVIRENDAVYGRSRESKERKDNI